MVVMDTQNVTEGTSFDSGAVLQAPDLATGGSRGAIGLVLAGHHPLTLCGLSQVFEKERDCTVLAVCATPATIIEAVRRHEPAVVILDFPRHDAFRILRLLQRQPVSTCAIVLASASDQDEMMSATQLGARAVVRKELSPEAFVTSIREAYTRDELLDDGQTDADVMTNVFRTGMLSIRRPAARQLTPREAEIANLAVRGISTKDIAARLAVKQGTVKIHLHSIYEKLSVDGRLGLILYGRRHRLV
jgi:DNA-binding NarL/FixJ family response regulator